MNETLEALSNMESMGPGIYGVLIIIALVIIALVWIRFGMLGTKIRID